MKHKCFSSLFTKNTGSNEKDGHKLTERFQIHLSTFEYVTRPLPITSETKRDDITQRKFEYIFNRATEKTGRPKKYYKMTERFKIALDTSKYVARSLQNTKTTNREYTTASKN